MKTLKISNGEIRKAYELNDLPEQAKENAIISHAEFLASMPVECEDEDGNMVDEYFDYDREDVIENIEVNGYLYDEDGEILPLLYYVGNHPEAGKILFNKLHTVEIIQ